MQKGKKNPFQKFSKADLADELGTAKAESADAVAYETSVKEEIRRRRIKSAVGEFFQIAVSSHLRWSLDVERITKKMGEAWVDRHSKSSSVTTVRCSAKSLQKAAA